MNKVAISEIKTTPLECGLECVSLKSELQQKTGCVNSSNNPKFDREAPKSPTSIPQKELLHIINAKLT